MGSPCEHKEIQDPHCKRQKDNEQSPPTKLLSCKDDPRVGDHNTSELKASSRYVKRPLQRIPSRVEIRVDRNFVVLG